MIIRVARPDRTRLIGQHVSDPCSRPLPLSEHVASPLTLRRGIPVHALTVAIWLVSAATACVTNPPRQAPVPPSATPPSPIPPIAELSKPRLTADSAAYLITSHTTTLEESAPEIPADSIAIHEKVIARLVPDSSGNALRIELQSDSGYSLPSDRSPPPETIPKEPERVTATAIAAWETTGVHLSHAITPACPASSTLVSQLIPLVLARFVLNTQTVIQVPDSIQYLTCTGGVRVMNVLHFSPMSRTDSVLQFDIISASDSSRALPMHTRGSTSGKATVAPMTSATGIPSRLSLSLDVLVTASSSIRHQRFRQQLRLELIRQ